MGMAPYILHRKGTVQNVVRESLTRYQAYAGPPQFNNDRLEQFSGSADWTKGVAPIVANRTSGPFKVIDQARADMLTSWQHSGFSIESETRLFIKKPELIQRNGGALSSYHAKSPKIFIMTAIFLA